MCYPYEIILLKIFLLKLVISVTQVQLSNVGPSEFVIRTQPTYQSLSTVESVAIALSALEKQPSIREVCKMHVGLCIKADVSVLNRFTRELAAIHRKCTRFMKISLWGNGVEGEGQKYVIIEILIGAKWCFLGFISCSNSSNSNLLSTVFFF